jgi:hypothetical protein
MFTTTQPQKNKTHKRVFESTRTIFRTFIRTVCAKFFNPKIPCWSGAIIYIFEMMINFFYFLDLRYNDYTSRVKRLAITLQRAFYGSSEDVKYFYLVPVCSALPFDEHPEMEKKFIQFKSVKGSVCLLVHSCVVYCVKRFISG